MRMKPKERDRLYETAQRLGEPAAVIVRRAIREHLDKLEKAS